MRQTDWIVTRIIERSDGADGRCYTAVQLDGGRYGICCDGQPVRSVVWPPERLDQCRQAAKLLASATREE